MEKYQKVSQLGAGTYGVVYKGLEKATGRVVALKKVRLGDAKREEGISRSAFREIKILKEVLSPFVVRLFDVFVHKSNVWVAMEYCTGDLEGVILARQRGLLSYGEADIKSYMAQILRGLQHLQFFQVLHRDIKPNNIMFGADGCLKLIDFGLSRTYASPGAKCTPRVFQLWYRAPELLLGSRSYGFAVDVWAAGCVFAELFRGSPLFRADRDSEIAQLAVIHDTLGSPSADDLRKIAFLPHTSMMLLSKSKKGVPLRSLVPNASDDALDLIRRMLTYVPCERITIDEALSHPFFTSGVPMTGPDALPRGAPKAATKGGADKGNGAGVGGSETLTGEGTTEGRSSGAGAREMAGEEVLSPGPAVVGYAEGRGVQGAAGGERGGDVGHGECGGGGGEVGGKRKREEGGGERAWGVMAEEGGTRSRLEADAGQERVAKRLFAG